MRALIFLLLLLPGMAWAGTIRLKDLVDFDGVRGNVWWVTARWSA